MPALTRRRDPDALQETWRVYYDDVQVGTISRRAGVPVDVDQWGWSCGFFPAIDRGLRAGGTTATFEKVRADFAAAWARYLPRCTDATTTQVPLVTRLHVAYAQARNSWYD
jgi:hypothetical protein